MEYQEWLEENREVVEDQYRVSMQDLIQVGAMIIPIDDFAKELYADFVEDQEQKWGER